MRTIPRAHLLILLALTAVVYARSAAFDFVLWDDNLHLTANPLMQPPTFSAIARYWTAPFEGLYIPLAYTLWTLIAMVAQTTTPDPTGNTLNPAVFHLANILLHAGCAVLVCAIAMRVLNEAVGALIGAAVFVIHPLQVESVAWISEFRSLSATALGLAAIFAYLEFVKLHSWARQASSERASRDVEPGFDERELAAVTTRAQWWYWVGIVLFALAILCKPSAVVVPGMIVAIDYLCMRRSLARALTDAMPLMVLAIPCVIWTAMIQPGSHLEPVALWQRPIVALDAMAWYLRMLVAPFPLTIDHGRTPQSIFASGAAMWTWTIPLAVAVVAGAVWRREGRAIGGGLLLSLIALAPVLGLVNFDFQEKSTVAERFAYLPMLGVAIMVGGWLKAFPNSRRSMLALFGILIVLLMVGSSLHLGVWRNSQSLLEHAVHANPNSFAARTNLAITKIDAGDYASAIDHARRAAELKPAFCGSHLALAEALALSGQPQEAEVVLQAALERKWDRTSDVADLRASLAAVWMMTGRTADARELAGQILKAFPNHPQALNLIRRLRDEPVTRPGRMP